MSYRLLKPWLDRLIAVVVLLVLSPLLGLVVVLILLGSPGPLLFRQTRIGLQERRFDILKFRTMYVDDNRTASQTVPGSEGVTPVGVWLRRLKIDELPQLINVLKGDMSLVGPRPCLPALLVDLDAEARQRFQVRPGLTGLAQVNGNIYLDWPERWKYDIAYVNTLSFLTDLRILAKTFLVVILGEQRFRRI